MKIPPQIDFRVPKTPSDLAPYLGVDAALFEEVISSTNRSEFYIQHQIPKRNRHRRDEVRIVWESGQLGYLGLVEAHKAFARRFNLFARVADAEFPHEAAFGYIRHRGTLDNATIHCGASLLLRADLHNFFPSITKDRLAERFCELGMRNATADALATFATIEDRLPLGLNASPMLANLVCVELDKKIQMLAQKYGCKYTRYADDISISGEASTPPKIELEEIVTDAGFSLSSKKFRVTKRGQAHYVTGLSISDPNGPHVPRLMKKRLRQELYYCKKFGIEDHVARIQQEKTLQSEINRLDGTVHYVAHIEETVSSRLKARWSEALKKEKLSPSYDPIETRAVRRVTCFIDETVIELENKNILALGLVFTEDPGAMTASTVAIQRKHLIEDPFYPGDKELLEKKGVHFSDAHPDLRAAYINALEGFSYRAFIIFAELKEPDNYKHLYLSLLRQVLRNRLIWYDRAIMKMIFEENSKLSMVALKEAVNEIYFALANEKNRRPMDEPEVIVGKKLAYPCFAVPDFMLAVFYRYALFNKYPKEENRRLQFERLRDKYRLIVDVDAGQEYSRRRPFAPWVLDKK